MEFLIKRVVLLLVLLCKVPRTFPLNIGPIAGPGLLRFQDVQVCDQESNNLNLQVDYKNNCSLSLYAFVPFDFDLNDQNVEGKIVISKATIKNGHDHSTYKEWVTVMQEEFNLLERFTQYVPNSWAKFRNEIRPNIESPSLIKGGEYQLDDFEVPYHTDPLDYEVIYGNFSAVVQVFKDGDEMFCVLAMANYSPT